MTAINPTADNAPGLPELLKYIAEVQNRACRLSGVVSAIAFLEGEGACSEGQTSLSCRVSVRMIWRPRLWNLRQGT
jgi:hypothetical protein